MIYPKKPKVLFLCTGNSARSQLAEALLRHRAGGTFDVFSAGTHPDGVDLRTIDALSQFGVATKALVAKNINIFDGQLFDYVITLCDEANNECRSYPNAVKQLAWDFPDPKTSSGHKPFSAALTEINNRLSMFLLVEEKFISSADAAQLPGMVEDNGKNQPIVLDPIIFYKSLTDDIRLKTLMLAHYHGELCVCELMVALQEDSQPKVSRNLAILKKSKLIIDRKHGQWVFYRINPNLPPWAKTVIAQTTEHNISMIHNELKCLDNMKHRPNKSNFCK